MMNKKITYEDIKLASDRCDATAEHARIMMEIYAKIEADQARQEKRTFAWQIAALVGLLVIMVGILYAIPR